jgi:hypothetical protein
MALACGVALLVNIIPESGLKDNIILIMLAYNVGVLAFLVIRSIFVLSFPKQIGLLIFVSFLAYEYIFKNNLFINPEFLPTFIIYSSSITAFSLLILTLLGTSINFNYGKIDTTGFKTYYRKNNWFCIILMLLLISLIILIDKNWPKDGLAKVLIILLSISPFLNKDYIRGLQKRLKVLKNFTDIGISFEHLGKLGRIKNFVFFKDKILSTGIYQIVESDYRSTVRVTTVIQIARILANEWNPRYAKLFVMDEFEKVELNYRLVDKTENGITVIDDDACMYHFGNSTYVKDKIKGEDRANFFLIKNDITIAKFKINEKIMADKIELMNQLDYYGNTLLIYSGNVQDLGQDYNIIFDKIYTEVNEQKQLKLLKDIGKKAPTAIFITKKPQELYSSICFLITSNIDAQNERNKIVLSPQKLLEVPIMIKLAKKVNKLLGYTLIFSFAFQLILGIIAFINTNSFILIYALNFGIVVLSEIMAIVIIKNIAYLPSYPANLDQSHQIA